MEIKNIAVFLRHERVSCWNFAERHCRRLQERMSGVHVANYEDAEEFCRALADADACMVWGFRQEWLDQAPGLKLISTPAAGHEGIAFQVPEGIAVMHGRFHGEIIGETVVGMLLAMTRGLAPAVSTLASVPWPQAELDAVVRPLRGSHVAILGLGHVGGWIGRLLKPFGVRISGLRRDLGRPVPDWFGEGDRVFGGDELDEVLHCADHVLLALPGGPDTDLVLNGHRIMELKGSATVINVGRGNAIDHMSLCSALMAGRIAGAFLDVFPEEPLPEDSMLRHCPNLWLLPHASAISGNYLDLYVDDFVEQLEQF